MYNLLCHKLQALQEIMTGRQKVKLRIYSIMSCSKKEEELSETLSYFYCNSD
jgi:hypothetical protein